MKTNGSSALQLYQDYNPALSIVEKPASPVVSPKPLASFEQGAFKFHALQYDNENRVFQNVLNGVCYHMRVEWEFADKMVTTRSYINGRFVSSQSWRVSVYMAERYSFLGYLPNVDAAVSGAYDHLQSLILRGMV